MELRECEFYEIPEWTNKFKWLAVVGSREFANPNWRTGAEDLVYSSVVRLGLADREIGITSGGAKGIDTLAEEIADAEWWRKCIFPPKNRRWAPDGFKARNETIGQLCNWMLAIRCEDAKSGGTIHASNHAESLGKPVERYVIHSNPKCMGCLSDATWKVDCAT